MSKGKFVQEDLSAEEKLKILKDHHEEFRMFLAYKKQCKNFQNQISSIILE
jgi:hypothetical protein